MCDKVRKLTFCIEQNLVIFARKTNRSNDWMNKWNAPDADVKMKSKHIFVCYLHRYEAFEMWKRVSIAIKLRYQLKIVLMELTGSCMMLLIKVLKSLNRIYSICTWTIERKRKIEREREREDLLHSQMIEYVHCFYFFVENIIIIKRKSCTHCVASMEHNTLDLILQMVYFALWTYLCVEMWMLLNVRCSCKKKKQQSYNIWDDVDINTCRAFDAMWIRNGAR